LEFGHLFETRQLLRHGPWNPRVYWTPSVYLEHGIY